jgi:cation:H+ antiporter
VFSAQTFLHSLRSLSPWLLLALFFAASFLLIWRLERMTAHGVEGTVLGTLVMPYCSGIGNLVFVFVVYTNGQPSTEVMTNCLVNNVTNMTLLIGLPTLLWGMSVLPAPDARAKKKKKNDKQEQAHRINRLSLLLTLSAVLFFTGATWALGHDGRLSRSDGLVLVGLFLFWQCFHVFDVLKSNVRQNKSLSLVLFIDVLLLLLGAYATYLSIDGMVAWISNLHTGLISAKYLGWLSGWLMVVPNGLLALYYGWKGQAEIVYTSQVGDGHICIPLCVGLYSLVTDLKVPPFFETGVLILAGATLIHFFFVALFGKLPRFMGWLLTAAYGVFLYKGLFE